MCDLRADRLQALQHPSVTGEHVSALCRHATDSPVRFATIASLPTIMWSMKRFQPRLTITAAA